VPCQKKRQIFSEVARALRLNVVKWLRVARAQLTLTSRTFSDTMWRHEQGNDSATMPAAIE
jgi:hypothetical protein